MLILLITLSTLIITSCLAEEALDDPIEFSDEALVAEPGELAVYQPPLNAEFGAVGIEVNQTDGSSSWRDSLTAWPLRQPVLRRATRSQPSTVWKPPT
jgi:hypothetical protein